MDTKILSMIKSIYLDISSKYSIQLWLRNSLIVSSATAINVIVLFLALYFWSVNRQTHFKKTKGSVAPHRDTLVEDDDEDEIADETSDPDSTEEEEKEENDSEALKEGVDDVSALAGLRFSARHKPKGRDSAIERSIKLKRISSIDYEAEDDEDEEEVKVGVRERAKRSEQVPDSSMKRSMLSLARTVQVFSYLGEEAQNLVMKNAEYIDVALGERVFKQKEYDGSLYAVLTGSVVTRFHEHPVGNEDFLGMDVAVTKDNNAKNFNCIDGEQVLSFVSNPGDVVTPLLAMLEVIVKETKGRSSTNSREDMIDGMKAGVSAVASAEKTRLIRVSPKCIAAIFEQHPAEVLKIVQTVFARLQRVTIQCVVKTVGLHKELIMKPKEEEQQIGFSDCSSWIHLNTAFATTKDVETLEKLDPVKADAVSITASVLCVPLDCGESMKLIKDESTFVSLTPGEELIETGMSCRSLYVLLKGKMEVGATISAGAPSARFHHYYDLQPGALIGLHATFSGETSMLTERSSLDETGAILLQLPTTVLQKLLIKHSETLTHCLDIVLGMIPRVVRLIDWNSNYLHVHASEKIIKRGGRCDALYVVLNGRLRASHKESSEHKYKEFGRGRILGEVGCLTGSRWPFDVYAIRNSEVAKLPIGVLLSIMKRYPHTGLNFARMIAAQVQSNQTDYKHKSITASSSPLQQKIGNNNVIAGLPSYGLSIATIAVVPFVADVDTSSFCSMLVDELKQIAPTAHATKGFVKEHLGDQQYRVKNTMRDVKITRLLGELEENHRLVVYEADFKYTWWTRQCVQQADCILLVVNSNEAPKERRVEQCLDWVYQSMSVRIELVVLHATTSEADPAEDNSDDISVGEDLINVSDQLNDWSEKRKWIANHHRIRLPFGRHSFDFYRMCRRITGRSVGLVLGGGGARGIAHLGVIRALIEAGVMVDLVGGTSQGAFIGALYAENPDDFDVVVQKTRQFSAMMSSVWEKLVDLTLPLTSIFSGKRFNTAVRRILGDVRIQDTVLTFFCTSVDVQKRRQMVHEKGSLWKYVRASMSLSGYLPPICEDGAMLVDGGYLNAVPADVMRDFCGARTVIAVDVSPELVRDYYEYGTDLSGWWLLWNSLNPFVKTVNVPSMTDINDGLRWVSSDRHKMNVKSSADLNFSPPVGKYSTLEFDKFDEIMEAGYNYAKPIVDEWVRKNPQMVSSRLRRSIAAAAISVRKGRISLITKIP